MSNTMISMISMVNVPAMMSVVSNTMLKTPLSKYIRDENGHFICPYCKVKKNKQNTMLYHIEKEHEHKTRFECKMCQDCPKFLQKCTYLHHLAVVHPETPHPTDKEKNPYANVNYACPDCDHTTHTKGNLRIHFARVHCEKWIPTYVPKEMCKGGCGKIYASSTAYLHHAPLCFKDKAPNNHSKMLDLIK